MGRQKDHRWDISDGRDENHDWLRRTGLVSRAAREYVKKNRTSLPRPRSMPLQAQDPFAGPMGLGGHFEGDAAGYPEHQKALVSLPIQPSHTNLFVSTDAAAADQREMELDCLNWERDMGHTTFIIPKAVLNYGTDSQSWKSSANLPRHNRPISHWTCSGVLSAIRSTKLANLDPVRSLGLAADYQ